MAILDYSTEGAIGRGIAEGLGKVQEKREADQLRELNKQWSIEAFNRAKAWEIEKMEMASRIDTELKNKRYVQRMSQWQAGDEYIDSIADKHPPEQVTMMRFTLDQQFAKDIPEAGARLGIGMYEIEKRKTEAKLMEKQQREQKPPSRTDITAAVKFLGEYDEKKNRRLWEKIKDPFAPGPTLEEDEAAEYFRDMLTKAGIGTPQSQAGVPAPDPTSFEPTNVTEFETTVAQLKSVDIMEARKYYNQWKDKF